MIVALIELILPSVRFEISRLLTLSSFANIASNTSTKLSVSALVITSIFPPSLADVSLLTATEGISISLLSLTFLCNVALIILLLEISSFLSDNVLTVMSSAWMALTFLSLPRASRIVRRLFSSATVNVPYSFSSLFTDRTSLSIAAEGTSISLLSTTCLVIVVLNTNEALIEFLAPLTLPTVRLSIFKLLTESSSSNNEFSATITLSISFAVSISFDNVLSTALSDTATESCSLSSLVTVALRINEAEMFDLAFVSDDTLISSSFILEMVDCLSLTSFPKPCNMLSISSFTIIPSASSDSSGITTISLLSSSFTSFTLSVTRFLMMIELLIAVLESSEVIFSTVMLLVLILVTAISESRMAPRASTRASVSVIDNVFSSSLSV